MCKVNVTEFRNNFAKYQKIAMSEDVEITLHGKVEFVFSSKRKSLEERAKEFLGILPSDATCGEDPYERG